MEFLKALFNDKSLTYDELVTAINAHNGIEANANNLIKVGNLGSGNYVDKGKFDNEVERLTAQITSKQTELDTANGLIEQLKKGTKGNEQLQSQITQYETTVADLQQQLQAAKITGALKVALLAAKASDIDYVTYKINERLKEQGKSLELDENENIKGWEDILSGIKTQLPNQFEAAKGAKVEVAQLPKSDPRTNEPKDLASALQDHYENK